MCVLSIKVPIRKKFGNLFNDPSIYIYIYIYINRIYIYIYVLIGYIYIYIYIYICVCVCVCVCVFKMDLKKGPFLSVSSPMRMSETQES